MQKTEKEKLESLSKDLAHAYFVHRDYVKLLKHLSSDISWFGTGGNEVCQSMEEANRYLEQEQELYSGKFLITDERYHAQIVAENFACVMAQMNVTADPESGYFISMPIRFSIVYICKNGRWKICHLHNSVPYQSQGEAAFFDRDEAKKDYIRMQDMAMAMAKEYINDPSNDDSPVFKEIERAMMDKLMDCLQDAKAVQDVMKTVAAYMEDKKKVRRALQIAGIEKARSNHVRLGRPAWTPPKGFVEIYSDIKAGLLNKAAGAKKLGVSPSNMTRYCQRYEAMAAKETEAQAAAEMIKN